MQQILHQLRSSGDTDFFSIDRVVPWLELPRPGRSADEVLADYEKLDGVLEVISGYTGGHVENPTYKQVSAGRTGHIEAVKVTYDANQISYTEILNFFWRHIDPTRDDGQFCDRGSQYRPAIFYETANQKTQAIASKQQIEKTNRIKNERNNKMVNECLESVGEACVGDYNVMEPLVEAVKSYATLQEVCDVFRQVFGEYRDPGIY